MEDQLRTRLAAVGVAAGTVIVAAAVGACGASGGWRVSGTEVMVESEREEAPKVGWVMVESSSVSIGWVMTLVAGEGASAGLGGLVVDGEGSIGEKAWGPGEGAGPVTGEIGRRVGTGMVGGTPVMGDGGVVVPLAQLMTVSRMSVGESVPFMSARRSPW